MGIRELKEQASEIIRRVREDGATYEVTHRGEVVATIAPAARPPQSDAEIEEIIQRMNDLAVEIGKTQSEPTDAVELVRQGRERGWSS